MPNDSVDLIAGIAIALAIPAVFWFAGYIRKHVPHGEARFDENGKIIDDE